MAKKESSDTPPNEEQIHYSPETLWTLIDALPLAIAVVDESTRIVLANQMTQKLVDKDKYALIGKVGGEAMGCLLRHDDPKGCGFGDKCLECRLRGTIQQTFQMKAPVEMVELTMTLDTLGERHLRISTLPMILEKKLVVLLAIEDVTAARQHEKDIMEKERLSAAVKTAGAVCHEFNQPLMIILGYVDLLLQTLPQDSPEQEKLAHIKTQVERLGNITGKLMDITAYKTKKYLDSEIVDIDASSSGETSP